jgi:hypothetical protein
MFYTALSLILAVIFGTVVWGVETARADVLEITATADVVVKEFAGGVERDFVEAADLYPETVADLPMQVAGRLGDQANAAAVAAQFADPREFDSPNPQEFAVNLALLSLEGDVAYEGRATVTETRVVRLAAGDFPARPAGTRVDVLGQFFVDGALVLLAPDRQDLSDTSVTLRINVTRTSDEATETLLEGSVGLVGGPDGAAELVSAGEFPLTTLIREDLAANVPDFGVFQVLIIPRVRVIYGYAARLEEPFSLTATVEVDSRSAAGGPSVAAVLGTTVDELLDVLELVQGKESAAATLAALDAARAEARDAAAARAAGLPACGLLGIGPLVLSVTLVGWRAGRRISGWRN